MEEACAHILQSGILKQMCRKLTIEPLGDSFKNAYSEKQSKCLMCDIYILKILTVTAVLVYYT